MLHPSRLVALTIAALVCATVTIPIAGQRGSPNLEALPYAPRHYVAYRATAPVTIDGKLDEAAWAAAPWTEEFVDIEGASQPKPRFRTRARLLWDDDALYVAAEMEEPELWGTLTTRDSVIFRDNDFELFIDPDGDSHAYYELEVNALGTPWDLLLIKPYRDGGPAINGWDIAGLAVGIDRRGTLNTPGDKDGGWTVELALPWRALKEAAAGQRVPKNGDQWRINFSRVEWQVDVTNQGYTKRLKAGTGDPLPENNWVWSAQGAVDMHMPERWGVVQFSDKPAGAAATAYVPDPNAPVVWALRRLYYRQRSFRAAGGSYATKLESLPSGNIHVDGLTFRPVLEGSPGFYRISAAGFGGAVAHIDQDGRTWVTR